MDPDGMSGRPIGRLETQKGSVVSRSYEGRKLTWMQERDARVRIRASRQQGAVSCREIEVVEKKRAVGTWIGRASAVELRAERGRRTRKLTNGHD